MYFGFTVIVSDSHDIFPRSSVHVLCPSAAGSLEMWLNSGARKYVRHHLAESFRTPHIYNQRLI